MIQANELRIGNLFNYDPKIKNFVVKAIPIDIDDIKLCKEGQREWHQFYKPIPITEEWLLKFNLKKMKKNNPNATIVYNGYYLYYFLSSGKRHLFYIHEVSKGFFNIDRFGLKYRDIKYVHQLQNLYFALTQTELTLKDA